MSALARLARTHPFKFGMAFSSFKTTFCDFMVQKYVEKREEVDFRRLGFFFAFGLGYLGGVQYSIYVPIFGRLFPGAAGFAAKPIAEKMADVAGQRAVVAQVFLDQFVHHPIIYFPTFYACKEILAGGSASDGLRKYATNWSEDCVALWKLWIPVMAVNFSVMPMWGRIPVVATASLLWTCIISYMRGSFDEHAAGTIDPADALDVTLNQGRTLRRTLSHRERLADPRVSYDRQRSQ